MDDSMRGLTTERLLEALLHNVGNDLLNIIGYGEIAKETLDSSHPAFAAFTKALQSAVRARAIYQQVGDEWLRRKRASRADQ